MKILQVADLFSPVHGGSAEVPYRLSGRLAEKGHEITVFASDYKIQRELLTPVPGVSIRTFGTWLSPASLYVTPGMISGMKREAGCYDVLHLHNYRTFQNIVARHYARKYGIPYLVQAHGSLTTFGQKGSLKKAFDRVWGYDILRDASKVIAVTGIEAEQYRSMGVEAGRIEVVPNGIDLAEFRDLPAGGGFRALHGLGDSKLILYLGRLHRTKGIDLLIRAFSRLAVDMPGARLVIAGPDGGYLPELKGIIEKLGLEDKVILAGPLYGSTKLEAYVDADIFVNPRPDEIFGLVFLEAMACGTPVVCSKGCGIADVIDGRVGFAAADDEESLFRVISRLLADPGMMREFGAKGRELVREKYDWALIAGQVERIYRASLAAQSPVRPRT